MDKADYTKQLEDLINRYESEEKLSIKERADRLKEVIVFGRKYNAKYKNPHKHYFMGKPIKYSGELLDELEKLILFIENLEDEYK